MISDKIRQYLDENYANYMIPKNEKRTIKKEKEYQIGDTVRIVTARTSGSKSFTVKVEQILAGKKVRGVILTGPLAGMGQMGDVVEIVKKAEIK